MLTKVEGQAIFAVLSFGGFLCMGDRHYPLPRSVLSYGTQKGGCVVSPSEQLEGGPSYDVGDEPN